MKDKTEIVRLRNAFAAGAARGDSSPMAREVNLIVVGVLESVLENGSVPIANRALADYEKLMRKSPDDLTDLVGAGIKKAHSALEILAAS